MFSGEFESSTCPICAEIYSNPTRRPVLLANCGHSLCEKCLTKMKSRIGFKTVMCPICRKYVTSAPINYQLMSLIEEAQKMRSEFTRSKDTSSEEKVEKSPTTPEGIQVSEHRTVSFYGFPTYLKMEQLYSFFDSIATVEIDSAGPAVYLDQLNDNGQGAGTVVFVSNKGADHAIRKLHNTVYPGTKKKMILKYAAAHNIPRAKAAEPKRSRPVPSAPPMSEAPEESPQETNRRPESSPQPPPSPSDGSGTARSTQHSGQPAQRRKNSEKGAWMNQCFIAGGSLLTCWITLGILGYTASHLSRGGKLYTI